MLFLSWRQLMARKRQTILILLSISFGTMLFVGISGVMLGMREYVAGQLLNNTAHVLISGAEKDIVENEMRERFYGNSTMVRWIRRPGGKRDTSKLENYQGWVDRLSKDPEVFDFAPQLVTDAFLTSGKFSSLASLVGTHPDRQLRVTSIGDYVVKGSFADLKGGANKIILGVDTMNNLNLRLNDYVDVKAGASTTPKPFRVVGALDFGNQQLNQSIAYANLGNVQTVSGAPGQVSKIAVALVDINKSQEVARNWKLLSKDKVEDWQEANKMFMQVILMQDFVRYFVSTAVLIVAAFGVYNVLSIMINQRRREIAILRSIGFSPPKIMELVVFQGIILGVSGGVFGMIFGFLLSTVVGLIDLGFKVGSSNHMLIAYHAPTYLWAFWAAFIASVLASYLPARSASQMSPIDIIREQS